LYQTAKWAQQTACVSRLVAALYWTANNANRLRFGKICLAKRSLFGKREKKEREEKEMKKWARKMVTCELVVVALAALILEFSSSFCTWQAARDAQETPKSRPKFAKVRAAAGLKRREAYCNRGPS